MPCPEFTVLLSSTKARPHVNSTLPWAVRLGMPPLILPSAAIVKKLPRRGPVSRYLAGLRTMERLIPSDPSNGDRKECFLANIRRGERLAVLWIQSSVTTSYHRVVDGEGSHEAMHRTLELLRQHMRQFRLACSFFSHLGSIRLPTREGKMGAIPNPPHVAFRAFSRPRPQPQNLPRFVNTRHFFIYLLSPTQQLHY